MGFLLAGHVRGVVAGCLRELTMVVTCGTMGAMTTHLRADRQAAVRRQLQRRSNATVPIPNAKHKRPRSWAKQQLRQECR